MEVHVREQLSGRGTRLGVHMLLGMLQGAGDVNLSL